MELTRLSGLLFPLACRRMLSATMWPAVVLSIVGAIATLYGIMRDRVDLLVAGVAVATLIGISVLLTDSYRNFIVLSAAAILPFAIPGVRWVRSWQWWARVVAVVLVTLAGKVIAVFVSTFLGGPGQTTLHRMVASTPYPPTTPTR